MRESLLQLSPPTFLGNLEDTKPHFARFSPLSHVIASPMEEAALYR